MNGNNGIERRAHNMLLTTPTYTGASTLLFIHKRCADSTSCSGTHKGARSWRSIIEWGGGPIQQEERTRVLVGPIRDVVIRQPKNVDGEAQGGQPRVRGRRGGNTHTHTQRQDIYLYSILFSPVVVLICFALAWVHLDAGVSA